MGSIIDGHRWVKERIGHLEAALSGDDLDDGQRVAINEELDRLRGSEAQARRRRWWRFGGGHSL